METIKENEEYEEKEECEFCGWRCEFMNSHIAHGFIYRCEYLQKNTFLK